MVELSALIIATFVIIVTVFVFVALRMPKGEPFDLKKFVSLLWHTLEHPLAFSLSVHVTYTWAVEDICVALAAFLLSLAWTNVFIALLIGASLFAALTVDEVTTEDSEE